MTTLKIETTLCKEQRLEFLNDLNAFLDDDERLENYLVYIIANNPIILKKGKV